MLKNKIFLGLLLLCGLFAACEKKKDYDSDTQLEIDKAIIEKYVVDSAIKDLTILPSGLRYRILAAGEGAAPKSSDSIQVYYSGRILAAKTQFDNVPVERPVTLKLDALMQGWQIALPLIAKGGQIRMIIPSPLAYKDFQGSSIPPNSILDYTVTLVNIK
ncbi:hypothetical protein DBR43_23185 [Pedobacter sp. KBW06]|uniref:FKBP-type peptidyl-prolyl cis-trans isomerase n=1 Tax=Pedobacter sp. KBW06 TaxID=2153359 RepID=UPI000F5AFD24|nr:FKBP-type peptidyl-prolyl cis-trans isomerase [Pedobacter sp. KBW06]RQO67444.1 hypothetical protein DBR43_23185 [Pedobacter sp. KBW06]